MTIIDDKVISQLTELGRKVKAILPGVNCNVQINLSKDPKMEPKVNLNLTCEGTKA